MPPDAETQIGELAIGELRSRRAELQAREDAVSYTRRVAQARLDLVRRRRNDRDVPLTDALPDVLQHQAVAPSGRPPRATDAHEGSPDAVELDQLCARHHFARLDELDGDQLEELEQALATFEQDISARRRALFDEIDAMSDELVRRYREGTAEIDSVWSDHESRATSPDLGGDGDDDG